jgi:cytochrome c553
MRSSFLILLALSFPSSAFAELAKIDFAKTIRPIFEANCFECHGSEKQKNGLRLDDKVSAFRGGDTGEAIIPGKSKESLLFQAITGTAKNKGLVMPKGKERLSEKHVLAIGNWIDQGAFWPGNADGGQRRKSGHWAFQPIGVVEPLKPNNPSWIKNPIDAFVLAKLEEKQITPSPEAKRTTLIRRLYLDLLGLLPTPEEVDAFKSDKSGNAYERVVDLILKSPHYGERWGRHWLDQARYADSHGYSIDGDRTMWSYRDWVIQALNDDMPFDRFTVEQLAGDLLPNPTPNQIVATAFHRNTMINQEGGSKPEQFRVEAVVDRVNTTGQVWLGLTLGCAQCHSHKFDPITQREYYQLFAFFNNTQDSNGTGPTQRLPTPMQAKQQKELQAELKKAQSALAAYEKSLAGKKSEWEKSMVAQLKSTKPLEWSPLKDARYVSPGGATMTLEKDGSIFVGGKVPPNDNYKIEFKPELKTISAVRLEVLPDKRLPKNGPGLAGNGNFVLTGFEIKVDGKPVLIASVTADHSQPGFPIAKSIDGSAKTGWAINVGRGSKKGAKMNTDHMGTYYLAAPQEAAGKKIFIVMKHEMNSRYLIGRFRLTITDASVDTLRLPVSEKFRAAILAAADKRTKEQNKLVQEEFMKREPERVKLVAERDSLKKQLDNLNKATPSVMVMRETATPRTANILIRGDYLRPGAVVKPAVPEVLHPLKKSEKPNRLDLANWIVESGNPLTARVTVNRIWMRYFGRGLVQTENDFGAQGTPPTHPKLLDWLASEFIRMKWSLKSIHKLIVMSATYRQSSHERPDLIVVDPLNRLLARQNRVRVEAEVVRDITLSASGLLNQKLGGPSVYPPQPEGIYAFTQTRKNWKTSKGPDRYRRGLYTFFYRSAPYPMLTTFDSPDFVFACTSRNRSNTPLQSLTMANDEAMVELARGLGRRLLKTKGTDEARIKRAYEICLSRPPAPYESVLLLKFLKQQTAEFSADAAAAGQAAGPELPEGAMPAQAAAWVAVARALINLDEFITRE